VTPEQSVGAKGKRPAGRRSRPWRGSRWMDGSRSRCRWRPGAWPAWGSFRFAHGSD